MYHTFNITVLEEILDQERIYILKKKGGKAKTNFKSVKPIFIIIWLMMENIDKINVINILIPSAPSSGRQVITIIIIEIYI